MIFELMTNVLFLIIHLIMNNQCLLNMYVRHDAFSIFCIDCRLNETLYLALIPVFSETSLTDKTH